MLAGSDKMIVVGRFKSTSILIDFFTTKKYFSFRGFSPIDFHALQIKVSVLSSRVVVYVFPFSFCFSQFPTQK
jgi:hypothetical protein